jgi:hypothetical protein
VWEVVLFLSSILLRTYAHVYDSQHAGAVEREEAYLTADREG